MLDFPFPTRCALCDEMGPDAICRTCAPEFTPHPGTPVFETSSITVQFAAYVYQGRAGQAVRRLKYERITSLGAEMSMRLKAAVDAAELRYDVVIPVPLHFLRRCERGFNQAEMLAEAFPESTVRPKLLRRIRSTKPQVGLPPEWRRTQLMGAFRAAPAVAAQHVLLIDDVMTTGGTANECAKTLLSAGARQVDIATFAAGT